jgi:hypothetical protein
MVRMGCNPQMRAMLPVESLAIEPPVYPGANQPKGYLKINKY